MQCNVHRLIMCIGTRRSVEFQNAASVICFGATSARGRSFSRAVKSDGGYLEGSGFITDSCSKRNLSTLQNMSNPIGTLSTPRGADWLMSYFPEILKELTEHVLKFSNPETATHFSKAIKYTMAGGKRIRGLTAAQTYEAFVGPEKLTEENIKLAAILGIAMEMSQASILGLDDIVDDSKLRRGQPCYYLTEKVGLGAINDCVLISKAQYHLLKKYFGHLRCYSKLMETFNEGELITMCGQTTDFLTSQKPVEDFNMELYKQIVANKTAYYTYNLPASLGMKFANFNEPAVEKEIQSILQEIGSYFQIQDDFLDCYGAPEVIGKVGNDIQEGKCTWLAVKFMELASDAQKREFAEIYGKGEENTSRVKELYAELGLVAAYKTFEDDSYQMIKERINYLPQGVPKALFHGFIDNIHGRSM